LFDAVQLKTIAASRGRADRSCGGFDVGVTSCRFASLNVVTLPTSIGDACVPPPASVPLNGGPGVLRLY
jgi:hypothetical protein